MIGDYYWAELGWYGILLFGAVAALIAFLKHGFDGDYGLD